MTAMTRAVVAALLGAAVLTYDRPGPGWLIAGLGLVLIAGRLTMLNAAALLLLSTGTFREAGWVFVLCVGAALVLLAASVTGANTWRGLVTALPRWLLAGLRAVPRPGHGAGRGLIAAVVVLLLFGFLLSAADRAFGDLLGGWLSAGPRWAWTFAVLFMLALGMRADYPPATRVRKPDWNRPDWLSPVMALNVLFGLFAGVQFQTLFGGHAFVLERGGPTYAQHARDGFLALAVVAVLTLAVVAVTRSRLGERDRLLAQAVIGVLCGLTLVIVASALWRMQVYASAFGYTRIRLASVALIVWVGLILLLIIVRRAFPKAVLWAGVVVLFSFVAINPDRYIAQTVIGRWEKDGHLDAPYLAGLSPDALPALKALPSRQRDCLSAEIQKNPHQCEYYLREGYRLEGNWTDPARRPRSMAAAPHLARTQTPR